MAGQLARSAQRSGKLEEEFSVSLRPYLACGDRFIRHNCAPFETRLVCRPFIKLNTSMLSTFTESHVTFTDSQSSLPTTPPTHRSGRARTITSGSYLTLGHYANPLQRVQAKPVRRAYIAKADAWPRQALDALVVGIRGKKVNWLVDANICGYYDTIDQEKLIDLIAEEISDDRVLELVRDTRCWG